MCLDAVGMDQVGAALLHPMLQKPQESKTQSAAVAHLTEKLECIRDAAAAQHQLAVACNLELRRQRQNTYVHAELGRLLHQRSIGQTDQVESMARLCGT